MPIINNDRNTLTGRTVRNLLALGVLGALLASQSGCLVAAAGAGAGTVAYIRGDSDATVAAGPEAVTEAAEAAVAEMKLTVVSSTASTVDGKVVARTANDAKLVVVVKSTGNDVSKVSVRVGNFGDEGLQQQVLEKIKARLAEASAAPDDEPVAGAAE